MTKQDYLKKLEDLYKPLIGTTVTHYSFGVGKIVDVYNGKCVVEYKKYPTPKTLLIETFFNYHKPISIELCNKINSLKEDYESSSKHNTSSINNDEEDAFIERNGDLITFDDVIGLDDVKETINKMIVYPYKYKKFYSAFKRSSGGGVLLYGAPGNGKTMIAKAIANEVDAKFFSIKCSDIVSKWFGESEKKIKELFSNARQHERSIIFFDEFDSLASNRDGEKHNHENRIVAELLSQIDGFDNKTNSTLLVASTNKPWMIDSALLRSGRFNKKIYIGLPNEDARIKLLIHELKDIPSTRISYKTIAKKIEGYSNADIVELCNEAKDIAIARSIKEQIISPITNEDVNKAISYVGSTVTKQDLDKLNNFSFNKN